MLLLCNVIVLTVYLSEIHTVLTPTLVCYLERNKGRTNQKHTELSPSSVKCDKA